jgi:peptidoglycan lytic transglycosylase
LHAIDGDNDMISRSAAARSFAFFSFLLPVAPAEADPVRTSGLASVYAYDAQKTAGGEIANSGKLTAAHRTLPFGTKVRVTNTRNRKAVVVRINDRGPFVKGRVIDVTPVAAKALGFSGLASVTLAVCTRSACPTAKPMTSAATD